MDITSGLGVDVIVDQGVLADNFDEQRTQVHQTQRVQANQCRTGLTPHPPLPIRVSQFSKHDVISSLAVAGRWVTAHANLQVRVDGAAVWLCAESSGRCTPCCCSVMSTVHPALAHLAP